VRAAWPAKSFGSSCSLTGSLESDVCIETPEYDEWLAAEKAEKEEHRKKVKELEGDPTGILLCALEKLTGKDLIPPSFPGCDEQLEVSHGSQPSLPQRSLSLWKREEV